MKLLILLLVLICVGVSKDCLDPNGKPVDYWLILKLPRFSEYKLDGW